MELGCATVVLLIHVAWGGPGAERVNSKTQVT